MEFRLFGEIQLNAGGQQLDLGIPRQQAVLCALLVDTGRPVPIETLIDRVWDDEPPTRDTLYPYLSKIRRLLKQASTITGIDVNINRRPAGYVLTVDPDLVDLHRFASLVERGANGRVADADRVAALSEALELWRGAPLGGISGEWVDQVRESWHRRRLDAVVHLGSVLLSLGRAGEVVRLLPNYIDEYPLAESLEALLMRAYHAEGRDAEALDRFARIQRRLAEALGTDPGPELRELHAAILRNELPSTSTANPLAIPAQLPPDVYGFAGRDDEIRLLDERIDQDSPARIVAVSGTAGVGKTTLAVHWAHRVRGRFPDGQLYVNLRGFEPTGIPVTPAEAVRGFLDAFDVPTKRFPATFEAQVGLYRSILADRRVLVVLDNARDTEQVRPLLAGSPGSLVLVTSRTILTSLVVAEGAHAVDIDLLDDDESLELLAGRLGADRVAAEPGAVHEIIELCARLPLALAVVAARAATHPRFSLAALAEELRAARGGLDEFTNADPTTDPRAVFSWSYRQLPAIEARMFRLIGLHSGPDIGARAAASLAGMPAGKVRTLLSELARANLLTEQRPGRYACHDLLRAYASEQSEAIDSASERHAARHRLLAHYIHSANNAGALIDPQQEEPPTLTALPDGVTPETMADHETALAWFNTERRTLLSVINQTPEFDTEVWELVWTMHRFLSYQGHWHDELLAYPIAVAAAKRLGDLRRQAFAHSQLGSTHIWFDEHEKAAHQLDIALDLYRRAGYLVGQAYAEHHHAWNLERQERNQEAFGHARNALELFRQAGHPAGQAKALNAVGWFHALFGDYDEAIRCCQDALALQTDLDDALGAGQTWHSLGYIYDRLGDRTRALDCYEAAIGLFQKFGYPYSEARALSSLGDTHETIGDLEQARAAWQRAVEILDRLGSPDADEVRTKLAQSAPPIVPPNKER